jgi:Ca2+-transporting ATPase
MVLAQMGNALAIRSNRDSLFTIGVFSNRLMVFSVLSTFVLQLALIYIPFFQNIFKTQALTLIELGICLGVSLVLFVVIEIYKWVGRRSDNR